MLDRLARWCYRHRKRVLLVWITTLVVWSVMSARLGGELSDDFRLPDTESQRAFDVLEKRFPAFAGDTANVVYRAEAGVHDGAVVQRVEKLFADIDAVAEIGGVASPYAPGNTRQISRDEKIAYAPIQFEVRGQDLPRESIVEILDLVEAARSEGLQVELGGRAVDFAEREGPGGTEGIAILAAIFILLVAFGSVIAMGLPVLTAVFGLGMGIGGIAFLAHVVEVPVFGPQLAGMIGIGVGIDYALFIVTRYRQGLHLGFDPEDAVAISLATSGRAVIFAGITVVISMLGMLMMGLAFVRGMALSASITVLMTVIAAITLLPAVLGFAGHAIDKLRLPGLHRDEAKHRESFWFRWSRIVQRRPWITGGVALGLLVFLTIPLFSIRLGASDSGSQPDSRTTRRAYDLLSRGFGPGFNGPFLLVAEMSNPQQLDAFGALGASLQTTPGVAQVSPPITNPGGDAAVMILFPTSSPQDVQTEDLLARLRDPIIPQAMAGTGANVYVGGITSVFLDLADYLSVRLPFFMGGVIAFSFLLLLVVFRSVLVPVKAAVMNVLSIGASYGVVVAIFQWGWLGGLFGLGQPGPIESFAPMMMFSIVFGLSMDYEVFLLSRVREEYDRTGDNALAVADGLASTARVITAAAAIMVTVFFSFVFGGDRILKLFGLGLATAIAVDATIVRLVLVPATMELLGKANWWLPRWLDKALPAVSAAQVHDAELLLEREHEKEEELVGSPGAD